MILLTALEPCFAVSDFCFSNRRRRFSQSASAFDIDITVFFLIYVNIILFRYAHAKTIPSFTSFLKIKHQYSISSANISRGEASIAMRQATIAEMPAEIFMLAGYENIY